MPAKQIIAQLIVGPAMVTHGLNVRTRQPAGKEDNAKHPLSLAYHGEVIGSAS